MNVLFRSVGLAAGPHAIGVLMSGVLDDGVLGMAAIEREAGRPWPSAPTTPCSPRCRSTPSRRAWWITR